MDSKLQTQDKFIFFSDACLAYLTSSPFELEHFMKQAGLTPENLQENLDSKALKIGMIDYFANNDQALLAMCAGANIDAKEFMVFWQHLNHS